MVRSRSFLLLGILLTVGCWQDSQKRALEVTYIANEGFMIAMGGTKVLIDALPKSKYYATPSDTLAANIMDGIPPFGDIDYALVTHDHADHFNPEMMSRFLLHHPVTSFIASSETCGKLTRDSTVSQRGSAIDLKAGQFRTIRGSKAEIVALRLDHSGNRDITNLAFIVRSNNYTVMHVGDAILAFNEEYLRSVDWSSFNVDLLFIEFFDRSTPTQEIIRDLIKPKHVILMHIPPGEEDSLKQAQPKIHPQTVVFSRENEMLRFGK
jgi:L-ascorbate metabolism protein UlaG (beta-lactamase superfamily)